MSFSLLLLALLGSAWLDPRSGRRSTIFTMITKIAHPISEMSKLLREIATERKVATQLTKKGAHRFAQFHWSVVKRDQAKLAKLIDQARQQIEKA